jgi:negative regulator of sigma E activity
MNDTWGQTLSQLLDDDDVDVDALAAALDTSEGRELLVQFASLRNAARRDETTPSVEFQERVRAEMQRPVSNVTNVFDVATGHSRMARIPSLGRWRYGLAAMLAAGILLGAAGGTWLRRTTDAPPTANRVLRFEAGEWTLAQGGPR